jgi:hypothetical protein
MYMQDILFKLMSSNLLTFSSSAAVSQDDSAVPIYSMDHFIIGRGPFYSRYHQDPSAILALPMTNPISMAARVVSLIQQCLESISKCIAIPSVLTIVVHCLRWYTSATNPAMERLFSDQIYTQAKDFRKGSHSYCVTVTFFAWAVQILNASSI